MALTVPPPPPPPIPVLRVAHILDRTTVVIVGERVETLKPGEELMICYVGQSVGDTGAPLVIPKATVVVATANGPYVVARSRTYDAPDNYSVAAILGQMGTVKKSENLNVDDKTVIGNPANSPVAPGDVVLKAADIAAYVRRETKVEGKQT